MTDQRHSLTLLATVLCLGPTLLAFALCLVPVMTAMAQSTNLEEASGPAGCEATQIAGLPDAKPNTKGQLTTTSTVLRFTSPAFKAEIPFNRITNVTVGDERIETGGTTGRIARAAIPFGGGLALATVTQKSVDLLTIEYLDPQGEYHGAVFFVPRSSAKTLSDRMASLLSTAAPQLPQSCEGGPSSSTSVVVEPIQTRGVELPAEYRVLLYEGLIHELRDSTSPATYVRAGSSGAGAGCSAMKLRITVTGFKKGNQALRASTGPVGLFVGKTSVSFLMELIGADGHKLLSQEKSSSKRMDSESLGLAKSVARAVAKEVHKMAAKELAS